LSVKAGRKTRLGISLHDCESIVEELGKYNATLKRDIELNNQGLYVISIIIKNVNLIIKK
jgi:hypothetical protein